ncbi:Zn-dependent hydrolase [bacterium SCN 62-11]|nr:Zn-dependent hydrolase [Candidatus Eremiobacteraeota bacterium]ODT67518.1 MAG: Zn-dependent hydrolase [bacterium SCN 62-11]
MRINSDRLYAALEQLGQIGRYQDEETGLQGVCRLALSAEDGDGRRLVLSWMRQLALEVRIDRIGNVYARRAGRRNEMAPVVIGSHVDSVPTAGRFDGCLGVLGGLEIVRTLNEQKVETLRPIEVAFFTDEEGCRFGTDMLGSAVACGRLTLEYAYELRDRDGLRLRDELERIGFLGECDERVGPPHAYLECHVEQGPILYRKGVEVGVVSGVQSISWQALTIVGKSGHAGATPMDLRADAGVAASMINLKLREMIAGGQYGEMRATMGSLSPVPGLVNIVPGRVEATVDLRNPSNELMQKSEAALLAYYAEVEKAEKVEIRWRQTARTPAVAFSSRLQERIAAAAERGGLSHQSIIAGAGHDAQEFAAICPAAMVFCPGEYDGISHNPREFSTPKQCADGVNVLLDVLLQLADQEEL